LFFINFEGLSVRSVDDVSRIRSLVADRLWPLGRKVHTIVNYDNFSIAPYLIDDYSTMVKDLTDNYFSSATRYTTNGFLKIKLGDALKQRELAPHIYETADEARRSLHELDQDAPE
jgi:propionate CoA-transferase